MSDFIRIAWRAGVIVVASLFVVFLMGMLGQVIGDFWGTELVVGWYSTGEIIGSVLAGLAHAGFLWLGSVGLLHDRERAIPPRWQLLVAALATLLAVVSLVFSPWRNSAASNEQVLTHLVLSCIVIPWIVLSAGTHLLRPNKIVSSFSVSAKS
jgi:hypothetical protein